MTGMLHSAPHLVSGKVTSIQASGGEATSCLFQFGMDNGESFQLNPAAPAGIFAAMAGMVTTARMNDKAVKVVSYLQLASGVWQVSFIDSV